MKRRKTQGSSMLLVIIIFGVISILGVSIMGVAYSNYSSRVKQNQKIKDLYSAESGLDLAYVKLCSVVQQGINEGIGEVNVLLAKGEDTSIEAQNKALQEAYVKYIIEKIVKSESVSGIYQISTGEAKVECILYDKDSEEKKLTDDTTDKVAVLTSTFSDSKGNERIVKVSYTLIMPENITEMNQSGGSRTAISSYSMATDENMEVTGGGNVTINGDVWIQGIKSSPEEISTNPLEKKYTGGLTVSKTGTSNTITFAGDVITNANIRVQAGQLKLKDGMTAFAENLYLGSLNSSEDKNSLINFCSSDLYLANDMVIADTDAKVTLDNLYAFNDINTGTLSTTDGEAARESSSIIINSLAWPNKSGRIEVSDSAYIMGLAYIKTNMNPYQTGESVAYKGNYKAYTNNLDSSLSDGIYTYLDPLVLITHDISGNEMNAVQKTSRFIEYSGSKSEKLRTKGIALPSNKTYTAGAYISGDSVVKNSNLTDSVIDKILEMKRKYVNTVNYMGEEKVSLESKDSVLNSEFLKKPTNTVANQVNWDGVDSLISYKGNIFEESDTVFILNNDESKKITVEGTSIRFNDNKKYIMNNKKYVIVTEGEVVLSGAGNYNGVVITRKDITMSKSGGNAGHDGGVDGLYDSASQPVKDLINVIFNDGDTVIAIEAITSRDIIQKEKWSIEK